MHIDSHEREDVVEHWNGFVRRMAEIGLINRDLHPFLKQQNAFHIPVTQSNISIVIFQNGLYLQ